MTKKHFFFILILLGVSNSILAQQQFDKEGHRGCRGLLPENSIPAMEKAVDLGVTLEMDISFSKDKIAIVSHDPKILSSIALKPNMDTITKDESNKLVLYQMPYAEISSYIFGLKPYPAFPQQQKVKVKIPTLSELIDSVETYALTHHKKPPHYNIETKTNIAIDNLLQPAPDEFVALMMKVIVEKQIQDRIIIQSFDPRTLEIIHKKFPKIPIALLVSGPDLDANLKTLSFKPDIYSPDYKAITENTVKRCHESGIKVLPWTVDEAADMERLKQWGVDGIISDYPNLL